MSRPIVTVTVNGAVLFHLVLDTAASGTTLDADTVKRANLPRDTATEQAEGIGDFAWGKRDDADRTR